MNETGPKRKSIVQSHQQQTPLSNTPPNRKLSLSDGLNINLPESPPQGPQQNNNVLPPMNLSPMGPPPKIKKTLRIQTPQPTLNPPNMRKSKTKMPKDSPYLNEVRTAHQAYNNVRVYHGVHHMGQESINQQGLIPQGSDGMSDMIGDNNRSRGYVFVTTDKQQGAYYANVSSLTKKQRLLGNTKNIPNEHQQELAIEHIMDNPPQPQIMRSILSPMDKKSMVKDTKGSDFDYMVPHRINQGQMLKGHNTQTVDMNQKGQGVQIFQQEMQQLGVNVSTMTASHHLQQQRRNSITGDHQQLNSKYAKDGAKEDVKRAIYSGKLPQF